MTTQRTPDAGKTMTDREMLELAALAYWGDEIDDVCSVRWLDKDECIGYTHADNQDYNGRDVEWCWNPLIDDGDALRLKVKLHFIVGSYATYSSVSGTYTADCFEVPDETIVWHHETNGDPCAAERLAITRAAAEVGRGMPSAMHTASTEAQEARQ